MPAPENRQRTKRLPPAAASRRGRLACRLRAEPVGRVTRTCAAGTSRHRWSGRNIWPAPDAWSCSRSGFPRACCHSSFRRSGNRDCLGPVVAPHRLPVGLRLHSNTQPRAKTGAGPARLPAKPESSLPIGADYTSAKLRSLLQLRPPAPAIRITCGLAASLQAEPACLLWPPLRNRDYYTRHAALFKAQSNSSSCP